MLIMNYLFKQSQDKLVCSYAKKGVVVLILPAGSCVFPMLFYSSWIRVQHLSLQGKVVAGE